MLVDIIDVHGVMSRPIPCLSPVCSRILSRRPPPSIFPNCRARRRLCSGEVAYCGTFILCVGPSVRGAYLEPRLGRQADLVTWCFKVGKYFKIESQVYDYRLRYLVLDLAIAVSLGKGSLSKAGRMRGPYQAMDSEISAKRGRR